LSDEIRDRDPLPNRRHCPGPALPAGTAVAKARPSSSDRSFGGDGRVVLNLTLVDANG
jgi:hypothetical protein